MGIFHKIFVLTPQFCSKGAFLILVPIRYMGATWVFMGIPMSRISPS